MIDIQKYKDYIAIFPKDSDKLCGLLKNDDTMLYLLLYSDYSLIYGTWFAEEDFKDYAWARNIENFVERIG